VITPRITRLLRVPDLQAMHRLLAVRIDPDDAVDSSVRQAIVVPTAGAREALARTLGPLSTQHEIITRDDLYAALHAHASTVPRMLTAFEREVLLARAARIAEESGAPAPFRLRPGLFVEILAFFDELRRRDRTVDDFERLMIGSLEPSIEIDRGAERMFHQTQFLVATFHAFERLVRDSGRTDEHGLRHILLDGDIASPYWRVVLTVPDQAADPRGLWTADFDLLARIRGLQRIDVIATENLLAAGFHQRIHDLFPGIVEERWGNEAAPPTLVTPDADDDETSRWFVLRDREEELAAVARGGSPFDPSDRAAVVFQRPLPYLYLARYVFADARREYQAVDDLPLAAEPFAAALDLVFAFLTAEANRASTIDLLSSPHWQFPELTADASSSKAAVAALDARLRELKYLGGWERLAAVTAERLGASTGASPHFDDSKRGLAPVLAPEGRDTPALRAAVSAAEALRPVREATTASAQIHGLLEFIHQHERVPLDTVEWLARHRRARAAIVDALESLARAYAMHDDAPLSPEGLAGAVRRWIDGQTFSPTTGSRGVWLLDAPSAAYADVDELRVVGLIEHDWPERVRRSIFYPGSLLSQLGWPVEIDRLASARARFRDLLRLPRRRVSVSTVTLEDDAIVSPSSFLEELESSGLPLERTDGDQRDRVFIHEALFSDDLRRSDEIPLPPPPKAAAGLAEAVEKTDKPDPMSEWHALRRARTSGEDEAYHGSAGPRAPGVYAISHVERYLECPFKYFAARVLKLDEERDDESGLSPQERGQLLHDVFETFFAEWHARGGRAITADCLEDALELFDNVAERRLASLPEADRALERTYLLGSAVAPGLAARAFTFEIEHDVEVLERLLEYPLEGEFEMTGVDGPRRVRIRSKADRIDLLADGTLRIIDYKLGRAPKTGRALQLPIYGVCAEQHLEGRRGRSWTVSRAGYVAFKEKNAFVALGTSTSLEQALEEGERRLVTAVDGIERGDFPVRPEEPFLCTRCGYAGVCRKDYVGDE
jgi:RecB family exonuclease